MSPTVGTTAIEIGFTPAEHARPDPERPPLLRARARDAAPYGDDDVERHTCDAIDLTAPDAIVPDLGSFGFDRVDLSGLVDLQRTLGDVRAAGILTDTQAAAVRAALDGASLPTASGRRLTVRYLADEGMFVRSGGPNGLDVVDPEADGTNRHRPARSVHSDQDVYGTPMTQLMDGRAPTLFRHNSPDGHNHDASLMLVNLWIPLHQITQPLVLADGRSIDRPAHQLRYQLPTESFLDRTPDQVVNDIWTFLHHPDQRWYFSSAMDHRHAYVFDTLSAPHGSATLPGEAVAERGFVTLLALEEAVAAGDAAALDEVLAGLDDPLDAPAGTPAALAHAIAEIAAVIAEAAKDASAVCGADAETWTERSRAARQHVVRRSIEMRLVVSIDD